MSKHTIQLKPVGDSMPINITLQGNIMTFGGVRYTLSAPDLTRLSIWVDDNAQMLGAKPWDVSEAIDAFIRGRRNTD